MELANLDAYRGLMSCATLAQPQPQLGGLEPSSLTVADGIPRTAELQAKNAVAAIFALVLVVVVAVTISAVVGVVAVLVE